MPRSAGSVKKSVAMRTRLTRREFLSRGAAPLVWRNLFYPAEILNALGVRMLTMETYAALRARNGKGLRTMFDKAARKGFAAETCSFLRVLEGDDCLPKPDFVVGTSEPCQQGERVFADLARDLGGPDRYHLLQTPIRHDDNSVESIAAALETSVGHLERSLGIKMDWGRLKEACAVSNEARALAAKCNHLRFTSPPLMRGSEAVLFATMFSQLWGKRELVELHRTLLEELSAEKESVEREIGIEDTHRLIWLHLPPFYSSRLMDFIELSCNAPVVFEEVNSVGWRELDPEDPYRSLARKLLTVGFLDPESRAAQIRQSGPDAKISGFLLYNHMFGRCSMADSCFTKRLREELQAVGIPLLVLDGDCLDETIDPCSTTTKVRAFVEALNLKKFGNLFGDCYGNSRLSTAAPLRRAA
jgi:benzoyl-CoA reductase/2-hydroxyglutaryl-CoA dehydratase subunit BcrC/BadD/HgdB